MKTKLIALVIALMLVLSAAACGSSAAPSAASDKPAAAAAEAPKAEEPVKAEESKAEEPEKTEEPAAAEEPSAPATDWTAFDGWLTEDWDAKEIAYQFTGEWELAEYGIADRFCINLYTDGSSVIDQRDIGKCSSYLMYGYWSEEKTEDGNEIAFDTLYVTGLDGALAAHEYNYTLYEEADGNYSFGYTFGIAPGMYFREAPVAGGKTVTYATLDEFHAAVDQITETHRFGSTDANDLGISIVISTYSNGTAVAALEMDPHGQINHKDGALKAAYDEAGSASYTLVFDETEIPLTVNEDGSFADFAFEYDASALQAGLVISSNMTAVEIPAEPAA